MDERTVTPLRWINITNTDELIEQVRQEAKEIQKKKKRKYLDCGRQIHLMKRV